MSEDIHWFTDESRARALGPLPPRRLYYVPAEIWREKSAVRNSPHHPGEQTTRPLVEPPVMPFAPSNPGRGPLDLDCERDEGLPESPRYRVGSMAEAPAHVEPVGRVTEFKTRSKARAWLKVFWLILTGQWRFPE